MAGAVFGDVGGVMGINHESHFVWQAQYSVMLEKHLCYSAHCK